MSETEVKSHVKDKGAAQGLPGPLGPASSPPGAKLGSPGPGEVTWGSTCVCM